jgi:hypothetical protein
MKTATLLTALALFAVANVLAADEKPAADSARDWPVIFKDDFETDPFPRWEPAAKEAWKHEDTDHSKVFHQFQDVRVKTPVRSPFNRNCLKDVIVGDLQLDVDFQTTKESYPHRSLCLFFGYQDPAHMYYVHFGQRTDDHANNIFVVNDKDRVKISTKTTAGTPWDEKWHHARIIRTVDDGKIDVYFDDMKTPVMTAVDKTFTWGQIGIGSFDDTGRFDNLVLRGKKVEKPTK